MQKSTVKKMNDYAAGAKMIRQWLKEQKIVARVTSEGYSMGSSINVTIYDQTPDIVKKVKGYALRFKYGSFDAMQDLYEYNNVNKNLPQAKYVFIRNELSDELKQKIYDFAKGYYNCLDNAPALYKDAYNFWINQWNMTAQELVWRLAEADTSNWNCYWEFVQEQKELEVA